jgi:tetratricopeptide (TPR) repeat protein
MSTLGRWLSQSGDAEAAEPMLRDALRLNSELLPGGHPNVALAQLGLAELLATQGNNIEALPLAEAAAITLARAYGDGHWITALASSIKGGVMAGLSRNAEAETLLRSSYSILSSDEAARPIYVEAARKRLQDLYIATGRDEEAAAL